MIDTDPTRKSHNFLPKTVATLLAVAALSACGGNTVAGTTPEVGKSPVTGGEAASMKTPGATETTAAVGKYDSSVTANMTPDQITQYYHLPAGDINKPIALMNDYTAASEGMINIGCAKEVWDKYGGDAHVDTIAAGDAIITRYVEPAMLGLLGRLGDTGLPKDIAIACDATRLQTIIDNKQRPDYHMTTSVVPNTMKVTLNPDGTIKQESWNVEVSSNLDPAVAAGMKWDPSSTTSNVTYTLSGLHKVKNPDGTEILKADSIVAVTN